MKNSFSALLVLCLGWISATGNENAVFQYEVDLFTHQDDAFHVTLQTPPLTAEDDIYQFVSFAPGVHQSLDYGRFVKSFHVFDALGKELITQKLNTNDWKIMEPEKAARIEYIIDDSRDMTGKDIIYPMSGTAITEDFAVLNTFGIFGYFPDRKNDPTDLTVIHDPEWVLGTALDSDDDGTFKADSYYHLADSPILAGNLSVASRKIGGMDVEAYVYSPVEEINAEGIMDMSEEIFASAYDFIGFSPVDRYTFLMYFHDPAMSQHNPVLRGGGALEHSYSSTYALPAMPEYLHMLKDIIAHEFMHILTPLNLRSEIIANFDYSKPTSEDQHLWLYEGVTEWVAHYMQLRSGDISAEEYLGRLSGKINNSQRYGCAYSLSKLSAEWSTEEGHKSYGNIYQLGALTASALNVRLLELSKGNRGLRDVYIEMINKYGKDKPFDNATFFDELVSVTYPEIGEFIENHIRECNPIDYAGSFGNLGIDYIPEITDKTAGPVFGLSLMAHGDKLVIRSLSENHIECGLKRGDALISVFGEEINTTNSDEIMAKKNDMAAGDKFPITVYRDGELLELEGTLVDKVSYHVFQLEENASKKEMKLRQAWLGNR